MTLQNLNLKVNEIVTMEFEFILPQKNENLLETTGNSYCVTRIFNEKECGEKLKRKFQNTQSFCMDA